MQIGRPDKLTAVLLAALIAAAGVLGTCSGCKTTTPASRYVAISQTWTALLEGVIDAHEAGLIDQETIEALAPVVREADAAMDVIEANLPADGGHAGGRGPGTA